MKNIIKIIKFKITRNIILENKKIPITFLKFIIVAFTLTFFLKSVAMLIFNVQRGFDLTDESFYIIWANQTNNISGSLSHFGYLTTFLYHLVGESIPHFRFVGILILLLFALLFAYSLDKYWSSYAEDVDFLNRLSGYLLILSTSLSYYGQWWLLTPSYNWLSLVATFIVASGLFFASVKMKQNCDLYIAGFIIGIGGSLAFIGKPTTALLLALISFFWLAIKNKKNHFLTVISISICTSILILLFHALFNFHGVLDYFQDLSKGLSNAALLGAGHNLWALVIGLSETCYFFGRFLLSLDVFNIGLVGGIILIILHFFTFRKYTNTLTLIIALVLLCVWFFWWLTLYARPYYPQYRFSLFAEPLGLLSNGKLQLSLLALFFLIVLPIRYSLISKSEGTFSPLGFFQIFTLISLLVGLSFAYAFGTGNDLIRQMSGSTVFLSTGIFYLAIWLNNKNYLHLVPSICVLMMTLTLYSLLQSAYNAPYRLASPISEQNEPVTFLSSPSPLYVDKDTATYIYKMQKSALAAGWEPGMPLIDLTGATPGAAVILDARILGQPWLLGGYPGSYEFVKEALSSVSRDILERAWILTASTDLNQALFVDLNLDFPAKYEQVVELKTGLRKNTQHLWRPTSLH